MKRELSVREKVLLAILIVLILIVGYYKLILTPINERVESCGEQSAVLEQEITEKMVVLREINKMEEKTAEIKASGEARAIPYFDNSTDLMVELHSILKNTLEYTLNFDDLSDENYIKLRPAELSFHTKTYEEARKIIDQLYQGENIMKVRDVNIRIGKGNSATVYVSLKLCYYELIVEEE